MLTIKVENFGPIKKAEVKLRPLTILVGANNVGKSYLGMLTYALSNPLTANTYEKWNWYESEFVELNEKKLRPWFEKHRSRQVLVRDMPPHLRQLLNQYADSVMAAVSQLFHRQVQRCFASDAESLRRKNGGTSFSVELTDPSALCRLKLALRNGKMTEEHEIGLDHLTVRQHPTPPGTANLYLAINEQVSRGFPARSYYLPAARSGIMQGYKLLASSIVSSSPLAGIEQQQASTLPGVIADFISNLLLLDRSRPSPPEIAKVASFLEKELSNGRIDIEPLPGGVGFPDIYYYTKAGKFPLSRASSMVSEIAPITLFLKYLVKKGDLLIIEEPEAHLHPDNQVGLALAVARLVRAGVQVVITTHSSDFVQRLSNLVTVNRHKELRQRFGFEENDYLACDEVSAYLFKSPADGPKSGASSHGTTVTELPVTAEEGIPDDVFSKIYEELYNETVALGNP